MAIETFAALSGVDNLVHGFVTRIPSVDVGVEREHVLERLRDAHGKALENIGIRRCRLWTAEQVHGNGVAACGGELSDRHVAGADGLVTAESGQAVGIYVADCCAVFIVDTERRVCGLVHSGKRGTELRIVPKAIELMQRQYGTKAETLIVQLSPCIRPPWYEVDFASTIREQCCSMKVASENIHDSGICTAEAVDRYYSYRREKGRTGRMLAVMGWGD